MGSKQVVQTDLKLVTLLPQPKCRKYRHEPPQPAVTPLLKILNGFRPLVVCDTFRGCISDIIYIYIYVIFIISHIYDIYYDS